MLENLLDTSFDKVSEFKEIKESKFSIFFAGML